MKILYNNISADKKRRLCMAKKKMSDETKVKLIYTIELLIFAVVFIVVATLKITRVLNTRDVVRLIFNIITILGGTWMIVDFIWTLCSKKKRMKNSLLDKSLFLPLGIYLITFDIICLVNASLRTGDFFLYMTVGAFYYIAACYIFEAIYHFFKPIPSIVAAIEEVKRRNAEAELEEQQAENEPQQEQPEEEKKEEKKSLK